MALIEKGRHPRFAIGESSSPLANLLLEEICDRYDLHRVRPLSKWGTWQQAYPAIGCGLKRGFSFFRHEEGERFGRDTALRDQLLVGASPADAVADTHWFREDVDAFLVEEARSAGAEYFDGALLEGLSWSGCRADLQGQRAGARFALSAALVLDASGGSGFLPAALGLGRGSFPFLPATQGLYSHFTRVKRLDDLGSVVPPGMEPPYPVDDAAVHHIFPGGWIWVLRFGNGITSAGVAATDSLARELSLADGAPAWKRLLDRFPTVRDQFEGASAVRPFVHVPSLTYRIAPAAGAGWALLPSAAAFVDPLLSMGFPLTLLGVQRLAAILEEDWGTPRLADRLLAHGEATLAEADRAAHLIAALYSTFSPVQASNDFPLFAAVSMLYFAAASFSETVHRMGRPERAGSFLCGSLPGFGPDFESCCKAVLSRGPEEGEALVASIARTAGLLDEGGLFRPGRPGWYPAPSYTP